MTIRIVLVGLGARAQYWMRVVRDSRDCTLVALVDPDPAAREKASAQWPEARAAASLAVLNDIEADAVLFATPPGGREAQIAAACAAGLAILAEKPLADSVEAAERYVAMAEAAGVPLMVGLNFRFLPVVEETIRLFDELGKPRFARFTYERWRDGHLPRLNKYPLTMDQPMLWEQSIHHFDLMRHVYADEPVEIYSRTFNPEWSMYAGDANVSALVTFRSGIVVNYQGLWQSGWAEPSFLWRHDGPGGVILQGDQFGDLSYARRHDRDPTPVALPPYEQWYHDAVALLAHFAAALRGEAELTCSGRDHLKSLRMVEACILSSAQGRATTLPADEGSHGFPAKASPGRRAEGEAGP